MDIDILYTKRNPLSFCSRLVRPENQTPFVYALDERKRVHEHSIQGEKDIYELCENLLTGKLFPSQPIPENNENNLIKICVHDNYEDLVLNSTKNIFLIIHKHKNQTMETDYENLALELKDYNLDIILMEAEKNYIPFEYQIKSYPTILYIPHDDKNNFVYYDDLQNELEFLKKVHEQPQYLKSLQQEQQSKIQCKSVQIAADVRLPFKKLPQFLKDKYDGCFEILDREVIEKSKKLILIAFMNFQGKCNPQHIEWLNKLYQLAEVSVFKFFIADFEDIDVINTKWQMEELIESSQGKPKIYALDRLNHTYEFGNFDSILSLYYFADSIEHGDLYYSQVYPSDTQETLVKTWTADLFYSLLYSTKKHIFITFYSSLDEHAENILNLLELLAKEVKELNVELVKFDIELNYVDLEYAQKKYPAFYFISKLNKRHSLHYADNDLNFDKMLNFIKMNVEENSN
ncbi:hypothetical protein FF38_12968 [Lucilia cuprina]|uniref:Thioredoxin domain-containing protein n=1 Tax=Lucilia cuprina TaxID=7375 RepID=A0A0L0BZQ7_LUCCU|nr:hypothetical protein FF38_12968 [Lucilia cuprina]